MKTRKNLDRGCSALSSDLRFIGISKSSPSDLLASILFFGKDLASLNLKRVGIASRSGKKGELIMSVFV